MVWDYVKWKVQIAHTPPVKSKIPRWHSPSDAVKKLRVWYPWRHSLLAFRKNISEAPCKALYLCKHHTEGVAIDRKYGMKLHRFQPVAKSSFRNKFQLELRDK